MLESSFAAEEKSVVYSERLLKTQVVVKTDSAKTFWQFDKKLEMR